MMVRVAVVVVAVAAATGFALRPEVAASPAMWLGLLVPYGALAAVALHKLWADGTLLDVFRPKGGDITIGILVAGVLLGTTWLARSILLPPTSPGYAWLLRVMLQVGDTRGAWSTIAAILTLAALEEVVWRGLVLGDLAEKLGTRRAWPIAAALYGIAHVPTAFTLADPEAGPNPLLVVGALGAGLFWSFLTSRTGRLLPAIASHIALSWFALPALGVLGTG